MMKKILLKKIKEFNQKGITLIGLIVTIIVLLILAGVSISLVIGDNGVLTQASSSVVKNREAKAKEEVALAWAGVDAQYWADWAKDTSLDRVTYFTTGENGKTGRERLNAYLTETGVIDDEVEYDSTTGQYSLTYTAKDQNQPYEITIDERGNVLSINASGTSSNSNTGSQTGTNTGVNTGNTTPSVTNYTVSFYKESTDTVAYATVEIENGKTIGNSEGKSMPANPTKTATAQYTYTFAGWKVGTNTFDENVEITENTSVYADWTATAVASATDTFGSPNSTYASSFGKIVTGYDGYTSYASTDVWRLFYADINYAYLIKDSIGNQALNSMTGFSSVTAVSDFAKNFNPKYGNWALQTDGSLNNNLKAVEVLMTANNWSNYKNSYANWAVGAPTLEMFIASYNATHTSAMHDADSKVIAQQIECTVEEGNSVTGYKVRKGSEGYDTYTTGLGNTSDLDKAIYCPDSGRWWLASPGPSSGDSVMYVDYDSSGRLDYYYYCDAYGVRPLVSVPISKIGNGITITASY